MDSERRLREHLETAAARLPEPPDSYDHVVRRGRRRRVAVASAVSVAAVVALLAVPAALRSLDRTTVTFDPAEQPPATTADATASPDASPTPTPAPAASALDVSDLRAPVLAYRPGDRGAHVIDGESERELWSGRVNTAWPDGERGVVLKPADDRLLWAPASDPANAVTLVEADGHLALRSVLPGGPVYYSIERPHDNPEKWSQELFSVPLARDAAAQREGSFAAHEAWLEGPAAVPDGLVSATCHLMCSLHRGFADAAGSTTIYHGGGDEQGATTAIDGLTSTPDGGIVAFVETEPQTPDDAMPPTLVLLDGVSFDTLARHELPVDPAAQEQWEEGVPFRPPVVSLSADGQRVLVSAGTTHLVEQALSDQPRIRPVDFDGVLRWFDPRS